MVSFSFGEKKGNKLPFGDEKIKTGRKKKQKQKEGEPKTKEENNRR
jgi:hypothetical protein